ncbi:MAG: RNA-directed DNA polymerase [Paracoccaceae bacterium]
MKKISDVSCDMAKAHFLKGSSYFNGDFLDYINFEPVLKGVAKVLDGKSYCHFGKNPALYPDVNYQFVGNKDGKFAWRPFELMHPAIYVSLVNVICAPDNWPQLTARLVAFETGVVECCSSPVISQDKQSDQAAQVQNWWQRVEQQSLQYSLEFNHVLHTDVTDCYGSIYTHSIPWAIHGITIAKENKTKKSLLGNKIDTHIQASRYGQTNGICQGSVLMDFIAELILGYVDEQISKEISELPDFKILRYRDDYRIFTNSDELAEQILKVISDKLRHVGMKLGVAKTSTNSNVVEGSIKPDKLAALDLQDLGDANAKAIQKKLLRLHSFGRRFPNSGALRRLVGGLHTKILAQMEKPDDLEVQVAIATDIAVVSPQTFPAIAGILSHMISLSAPEGKEALWKRVHAKMAKVPHNGYLEIWMQRITKPKAVGLNFESDEAICQIVNGKDSQLWANDWISSNELKKVLAVSNIIVGQASDAEEVMQPKEIELFTKNAEYFSL